MVEPVKPEKPVVADVACANCIYFVKSMSSIGQGECHRNPPTLMATSKGPASMHVPVKEGGFCGEFKDVAGGEVMNEVPAEFIAALQRSDFRQPIKDLAEGLWPYVRISRTAARFEFASMGRDIHGRAKRQRVVELEAVRVS